jgi:hypothetical protein
MPVRFSQFRYKPHLRVDARPARNSRYNCARSVLINLMRCFFSIAVGSSHLFAQHSLLAPCNLSVTEQ